MKKVSTRAAVQIRNISQQKLTVGLDLGDRNSWYCVLDESGQIPLEQRGRCNFPSALAKPVRGFPVAATLSARKGEGAGEPTK
jgi:hypothetical protein